MRSTVLLSLVLTVSLLAETPVSPITYTPVQQGDLRWAPRVAAGDGFLVTWEEYPFGVWPGAILARAYDADGTPRTPAQNEIARGTTPRAVWTGENYLVVYARFFSRFNSSYPLPAVDMVLVRPDGSVVENSRVTIASAPSAPNVRSLAWNGTQAGLLVVIDDENHFIRMDRFGAVASDTVVDRDLLTIVPRGDDFELLTAVAAANGAVIATTEHSYEVRIGDEHIFLAERNSTPPTLAWDGSSWLATYSSGTGICMARLTNASDLTRDCSHAGTQGGAAAQDGHSLLAWIDQNQVRTDAGIASMHPTPQIEPAATVDGDGLLIAWIENGDVHLVRPNGEERIIEAEVPAHTPRLATNGEGKTLLVWGEASYLFATRLDRNDRVALGAGTTPSLAAREHDWLVAFKRDDEIVSTRITANGDPTGLQHFGGTAAQFESAVAATPSGWLVLWTEAETAPDGDVARLVIERLDANGARVSGGIRLVDEQHGGSFTSHPVPWLRTPAIDCDAEACLVPWNNGGEIDAMLVHHDGTPITTPYRLGRINDSIPHLVVRGRDVYAGGRIFSPAGARTWRSDLIALGDVVSTGGRITAVYARNGRVYFQELARRMRALRH